MVTLFLTFIMLIYFLSERIAISLFDSGDPEALKVDKDFRYKGLRQDVDEAGGRAWTASYINSFSMDILFFGIMIFAMRLLGLYTAFTIDPVKLGLMSKDSLVVLAENGFPKLRKLLTKYYNKGNQKGGRQKYYQKWSMEIIDLYEDEVDIETYIKLKNESPWAARCLFSSYWLWYSAVYVVMCFQFLCCCNIYEDETLETNSFKQFTSVKKSDANWKYCWIYLMCSSILFLDALALVYGFILRPMIIRSERRVARITYFVFALLDIGNAIAQLWFYRTFNRIVIFVVFMPLFRGERTRELLQISMKVLAQAMGLITNVFWFIWCALAIGYPCLCTTHTGGTGSLRDTFYALGTAIMIGEGWPDAFYWAVGTYPAMWFFYAFFIMGGCLYVISAVLSVFEFEFDQYFELASTRQAIGARINHVAGFMCVSQDPAGFIEWEIFSKLLKKHFNLTQPARKALKQIYVEPEGVDILSWTKIFHHIEISEIIDERECDWHWIDQWKYHVIVEFLCLFQVILSGKIVGPRDEGETNLKVTVMMDKTSALCTLGIFAIHFAHYLTRFCAYRANLVSWTNKDGMNTVEFSFFMDSFIWICIALGFGHVCWDLYDENDRKWYPFNRYESWRGWQVQAIFAATTMRIFTFNNPMFHMIAVSITAASPMCPILICLLYQTSCALSFGSRILGLTYEFGDVKEFERAYTEAEAHNWYAKVHATDSETAWFQVFEKA